MSDSIGGKWMEYEHCGWVTAEGRICGRKPDGFRHEVDTDKTWWFCKRHLQALRRYGWSDVECLQRARTMTWSSW